VDTVVLTAVFGVPPKTFAVFDSASPGVSEIVIELAGGTPAKATDGTIREMSVLRVATVALPSAWLS
jgi:hypothetical protein